MGIKNGPEVGRILEVLLEEVIDERIENTREMLMEKAKELNKC